MRCSSLGYQSFEASEANKKQETIENERKRKRKYKEWKCIDSYYWTIGYMCTTWWLMCFLYSCLPGFQVNNHSPGFRLKLEGVTTLHPVVLVPGIVTGGLELWEGRPCARNLFRKKLWGDSFAHILKRYPTHLYQYFKLH